MRKTVLQQRSALAVLGLDEKRSHSEEDVKAAFRRRAKMLHPDAGGSEELFRELYEAYGALRGGGVISSTNSDGGFARGRRDGTPHSGSSSGGFGVGRSGCHCANSSTRDFYRPYTSNPFAHGFTAEEVREAERVNRSRLGRLLLKHGLLWGCLMYFIHVYLREDRIRRAVDARDCGYSDTSYWTRLQEDKTRGLSTPVQPHWLDVQNEQLMQEWNKGLQRRRTVSMFGSGAYVARPLALTYQGRPFTATGVRGARSGVAKNDTTYEDDVHCEPDDAVDD